MKSTISTLVDNVKSSTRLDHVTGVLRLNDNASLRWVSAASTTVNEETRAATHAVGAGWV